MQLLKLLSLCLFVLVLHGADEPLSIWLSSSVVVGQKAQENSDFNKSTGEGNIHLREAFLNSFKNAFPNAVETIDTKQKKRTAAVFLTISRASIYEVKATDSNVVLYSLPVTATINFMNILTGELLYSQVYTHIGNIELTVDDPKKHDKIAQEYQETYKGLIDELATSASKSFIPKKLQVKIVGKEFGLIILDKGLADGIGEGDGLDGEAGSMFKVKYSSIKYSVAKEEFGNASIGSNVTKTYNQSLADIKKPKVTLLDINYDHDKLTVPPNMFYQFFVDKLAQKGSFTLVPINKSFWKAINALQGSANLGMRFSKRSTPEYFMRLWVDGPYMYDLPTNVSYSVKRNYHMTICGEIVNTSSRVVAASCKYEKIEDSVSFGKAYSKEAQYEVLAKNAALSLAEEFAQTVSFEPISYQVAFVDKDSIEILDEKNLLNIGSILSIYRNLGEVGGISNVYIPILEASIERKEGNKVYAKEVMKTFNGAPNVEANDMIFEQIAKGSNDTSKLFSICDMPSKIGTETIDGFEDAVKFIIAKNLKYPFYDSKGLQESINKHIDATEFENVPQVLSPIATYCISPVYKYGLVSSKDSEQAGYLENKYSTIIGVKEFQGEEVKSKFGLGGDKSFYPPLNDSVSYLHTNLLEQSLIESENAMKKLEIK